MIKAKVIDDVPIPDYFIQRLERVELPLVIKYSDLELGVLVENFGGRSRFKYYIFVDFHGHQQRVDIRGVECQTCKWSGYIGNPFASDIYFGISTELKPHELMAKARYFKEVPCPKCGTAFNQFAIWAGELP